MTCEDCQAIVIELARDRADPDAVVHDAERDEARRHAALCSRCGEALQEQLWLTEQVRALAAEESTQQAPERVEIAVLAAWRAHHGAGRLSTPAAAAAAGNVVTFEPARHAADGTTLRSASSKRWLAPAVIAAALASAALAVLFVWPGAHSTPAGSTPGDTRTVAAAGATPATAPRSVQQPAASDANPGHEVADAAGDEPQVAAQLDANRAAREGSAVRAESMMARADIGPGERADVRIGPASATSDNEFQPLPYVEPLRSTEARHIVRVSLTSSDEMMAGVMPIDRRIGETTLEADVLVGEDGIARAIRIVR